MSVIMKHKDRGRGTTSGVKAKCPKTTGVAEACRKALERRGDKPLNPLLAARRFKNWNKQQ